MKSFGLTLVGTPAPTAVPATLSTGARLPRVYVELLGQWGRGAIGGDFVLHGADQIEQMAYLFEREVELDPELAERSPTDRMPLDEWRGLASFACRDRLELAWVRGREDDGPIWAIDLQMGHFARVATFAELPLLLGQLDTAAPPGAGMRWGFSPTFVTRAESERLAAFDAALSESPETVLAMLPEWEERASAYAVYASAIDSARAVDDGSERARAVLALLEERAIARVGRVPV